MKKFNKIILYGLGNGRDHANHIELAKCRNKAGFETFGITKEVAKLETVKEYAKKIYGKE